MTFLLIIILNIPSPASVQDDKLIVIKEKKCVGLRKHLEKKGDIDINLDFLLRKDGEPSKEE